MNYAEINQELSLLKPPKTLREAFCKYAQGSIMNDEGIEWVALFSNENDVELKVIEVCNSSPPLGFMPVYFAPINLLFYPIRTAIITEDEWQKLISGKMELPEGWTKKPVIVLEPADYGL